MCFFCFFIMQNRGYCLWIWRSSFETTRLQDFQHCLWPRCNFWSKVIIQVNLGPVKSIWMIINNNLGMKKRKTCYLDLPKRVSEWFFHRFLFFIVAVDDAALNLTAFITLGQEIVPEARIMSKILESTSFKQAPSDKLTITSA